MPTSCCTVAIRKNTEFQAFATDREECHARRGPSRDDRPIRMAASIKSWSCDLIERAALPIQNTIDARMPVASSATQPSNSSCAFCGNSAPPASSAMPSAAQSTAASTTPTHTAGSAPWRPVCLRYPAMMPTISAASMPSRSMIKNATSKGSSFHPIHSHGSINSTNIFNRLRCHNPHSLRRRRPSRPVCWGRG